VGRKKSGMSPIAARVAPDHNPQPGMKRRAHNSLGIAIGLTALLLAFAECDAIAGFAIAPSDSLQATPAIASDGAGGAFVLWSDYRYVSNYDPPVDAQHIAGAGGIGLGWPTGGLQLPWRSSEAGQMAIPDGAGGVFTATGGWDWYGALLINHLGADGQSVPPWPADGAKIWITSGPEPNGARSPGADATEGAGPGDIMPSIALADSGGLLVSWTHVGKASQSVHVMKLTSAGTFAPGWSLSVLLRGGFENQWISCICGDGSGGALVAWYDEPGTIIADHVMADGTIDSRWPIGGLVVSDPTHTSEAPGLVADGHGGCFVAWQQGDATGAEHPALQHLLANGSLAPGWGPYGRSLAVLPSEAGAFRIYNSVSFAYSSVIADGAGGAIVAWSAIENGIGRAYVQRVLGGGALSPAWPVTGYVVAPDVSDQRMPCIAADGSGGAFVAWQEGPGNSTYNTIIVQHVGGSGSVAPGWPRVGATQAAGPGTRCHPVAVSDGAGGAVVAWEENAGGRANIFAGRAAPGMTDVPRAGPTPAFSLAGFRPNPSLATSLRVAFELASSETAMLDLMDVAGRLIVTKEVGSLGPGAHMVMLEAPRSSPSGLYWVRLRQAGHVLTARGAVIR